MEAKALTPGELFDGKVTFEIPVFQRPYVWSEDEQWQPLWDDVVRVVEAALDGSAVEASSHFLGAVVLKTLTSTAGEPTRWSVIDGQQRLTTLQVLLDAAQRVTAQHSVEDAAESLGELVVNSSPRFQGTGHRFKLRPSRADRAAFEAVMEGQASASDAGTGSRVAAAHSFFRAAVGEWAAPDPDGRLTVLAEVLHEGLQVVAIHLGDTDDDQLIFETLNDRGTPLLAADLIKNEVFSRLLELNADVDALSETYWADFDEDWWRGQVAQGRLYRSRIDLFLQYWLTTRLAEEVPADGVFIVFRSHAAASLQDLAGAKEFLRVLRADADTFRGFAELDADQPTGRFYTRVVEELELGAFVPVLLWLHAGGADRDTGQIAGVLAALESWVVRRTLLRLTMKDVNRFAIAVVSTLAAAPGDQLAAACASYLAAQDADSRYWPHDQAVLDMLPKIKAYGSIKQQRLRSVLSAIEQFLRTERHESVSLPAQLDVEHVMPQGWRSHWGADVADDLAGRLHRDSLVNTLGNLTLVTSSLNTALSNRPWTDQAAAHTALKGRDAGLGKRSLLSRYSTLVLNKWIVDGHIDAWTDTDIEARSAILATLVCATWPGPSSDAQHRASHR